MSKKKNRPGISPKVSVGTLTGAAVGIITALLVFYVPAWHSGLPYAVSALLPVLVAAAGHFAGGYLTKHPTTLADIKAFAADLMVALGQLPPASNGNAVHAEAVEAAPAGADDKVPYASGGMDYTGEPGPEAKKSGAAS